MKKKDICKAEFFHYEERTVSFSELTQVSGLSSEILVELIEFGVVEPEEGESPESWIFSSYTITMARKALKLRELEKRVKELECQLMK